MDSFYTVINHKDISIDSFRLTHLLFTSLGTLDDREERIRDYYKRQLERMKKLGNELCLSVIGCYSNLYEFYKFPYEGFCTFYASVYGSAVFALQNLISKYYMSSGDPISEFSLDLDKAHGHDGQIFDVFSFLNMNTDRLTFYSTGAEVTRIQKLCNISDNSIAQNYLTVCVIEAHGSNNDRYCNCENCPKCLRTMVQLYCIDKLDKYSNVFDVESFYRNKDRKIAKMLATNKRSYVADTKKAARENGISISIKTYFWEYLFYKPLEFFSCAFRNNRAARKVYYALRLDYKIHGYRDAKYDAFGK